MRRRDFLSLNLSLLGGVIIGRQMAYADALSEFAGAYQQVDPTKGYDLVVNGGGLVGCFVAMEAAKQGFKVLLLEKRTFLGFDIVAKRKLWLKSDGYEKWPEELGELFAPEAERKEALNDELTGFRGSCIDDEMLLFAGSVKKGLLRSLLANKVDVMLMTDAFGVPADSDRQVTGIVVACKQGTYTIPCRHIIDATDNLFFTRNLIGEKYTIRKAGFVMELENAPLKEKTLTVDASLGLTNHTIHVHRGKKYADQRFLEFQCAVNSADLSEIEQQMRRTAARISKHFPQINPLLSDAKNRFNASECSYVLTDTRLPEIPLKGYTCVDNATAGTYCCTSITEKLADAMKAVKGISLHKTMRPHDMFYYSGRKMSAQSLIDANPVSECGKTLPLSVFHVRLVEADEHVCPLLIAGGGTAGVPAAISAMEQKCKPLIVDYFNELGGSKTMGGVLGYYLGLNKHPFIQGYEKGIKTIASEYHLSGVASRCQSHLPALNKGDYEMITGAIICGARTSDDTLKKIAICENGRLKWITAELTIDATGDADVAYFAGEKFLLGNSRIGITQNYSQWDIPYRKKDYPSFAINKDYDILDTTHISELQRGLFLSHYEAMFYDFYPMLTVRESRRPEGEYTLTLTDVLEKRFFDDTIANAHSDFDPHYYGESEYTRCGFLLPHSNELTVSIPYRSIVPKRINGLLFSGRGISQTHNALQFTRMSADVALLGYATGQIAAEIIRRKIQPRVFSVVDLHRKWKQEGFIENPDKKGSEELNTVVQKLVQGDETYLTICCRTPKEQAIPALQNAFRTTPSLLPAMALAWFGESSGNELIRKDLTTLFDEEQKVGHPDDYYEEYKGNTLYWKINRQIGLLGMTTDPNNHPLIQTILSRTTGGGKKVPAGDAYNRNRIDLYLIPNYNRILNLCFYIERNPDPLFIKELERLLEDEQIRNQLSVEYDQPRWRIFGALLEITLASSLARCGAKKGYERLRHYLEDIHANLRDFASRELSDVSGKAYRFDLRQWDEYIQTADFSKTKPLPVRKEVEI